MKNDLLQAALGLFSGIRLSTLEVVATLKGKKPEEVLQSVQAAIDAEEPAAVAALQDAFSRYTALLTAPLDLMKLMQQLDGLVDDQPILKPYREYMFDLCYIGWLANQEAAGNDDWMEQPEWLKIEDKVAERGTEMLNLLMYLQEVRDSQMKATLDDFIEGYLGDDELEFQDDLEVYEEVIAHQEWLDLNYQEMVAKAEKMAEETAIPEVFTPLFCFFKSPEKAHINLLATIGAGGNVPLNLPVSLTLACFYKGSSQINAGLLLVHLPENV
jgi:hypothetical protein